MFTLGGSVSFGDRHQRECVRGSGGGYGGGVGYIDGK